MDVTVEFAKLVFIYQAQKRPQPRSFEPDIAQTNKVRLQRELYLLLTVWP
jgi:hypothetical protein